jgi:type IV pilus biogenesis protein CpaD/CtpE
MVAHRLLRLHPSPAEAPLLAAFGLLLAGCASGSPAPGPLPPQTLTRPAPIAESGITPNADDPAPTPSPSASNPPGTPEPAFEATAVNDVEPRDSPNVVVLGSSEPQAEEVQQGLVAAAMNERARRRDAEATKIVVNDKNLASYASGGSITVLHESAAAQPSAPPANPDDHRGDDESYWRGRARELRQDWADAAREVTELQKEAEGLRRRFYDADDPYVRDAQIKPAWDRALARLAEARDRVTARQDTLRGLMEEGRKAGALPGWLREGSELEPPRPPEADKRLPVSPNEPDIIDQDKQPLQSPQSPTARPPQP